MTIFNSVYKSFSQGWQPGVNTLGYRPLNGNYNDAIGGNNGTATSGMGFVTLGDRQVAQVNSVLNGIAIPGTVMNSIGAGDFTFSIREKLVSHYGSYDNLIALLFKDADPRPGVGFWWGTNEIRFQTGTGNISASVPTLNSYHLFTITRVSGEMYCYLDGDLKGHSTYSLALDFDTGYIVSRNSATQTMNIGTQGAEVIIENVGWTAQEVLNYFNQTKGDYGIS